MSNTSGIDPYELPDDLPVPRDDGAADHLPGAAVPAVPLPATDGRRIDLSRGDRPTVVYAYPSMGRPGEPSPAPDWDAIPGARGCTPESCGFRDHHAELVAAGASSVYGLSSQGSDDQREAAERLGLPFPLLSDAALEFTQALRLPTFDASGQTFIRRLTMLVADGRVTHVWYPVFPPDRHAEDVLAWLRNAPG